MIPGDWDLGISQYLKEPRITCLVWKSWSLVVCWADSSNTGWRIWVKRNSSASYQTEDAEWWEIINCRQCKKGNIQCQWMQSKGNAVLVRFRIFLLTEEAIRGCQLKHSVHQRCMVVGILLVEVSDTRLEWMPYYILLNMYSKQNGCFIGRVQ